MADSSVLLEVIVEGKNIKIVQREVEELGASINKTTDAEAKNTKEKQKNTKATDDATAGSERYNRGQKGVAGATSNSTKAFSKQRDAIGGSNGLVAAYATVAATLFAATAAFGALRRASQVEQLEAGLTALGATSGIAMRTLSNGLAEATGNAISLEQAMRSTAQIVSAGLDPSSIEEFGEAARNISVALGRNVTDSLDRLTRGISKLEPELLDELGLFVRVDEAVEKYAQSLGKSASELTNFERRIAFQNETLSQAEEKFGAIGDRVDVSPYDKLAAALTDLAKTVTTFISVAIEPLVSYLAMSPVALLGVVGALGGKVVAQAVSALIPFNINLASLGKLQKKVGTQIASELPKYTKQSKALKGLTESMKAGNSTFEQRDAALKEQARNVKSATTRLENLKKKQAQGVDVTKKLAAAEVNLDNARKRQAGVSKLIIGFESQMTKAKNQNTVAVLLNDIAQGRWTKAKRRMTVATLRFTRTIKGATKNLTGFTRIVTVAKLGILGFARGFKTAMIGIVSSIPIIGQIIAVLMILFDVLAGVWNYFKSDETKRFEENLSSAKDNMMELGNATKELDGYFKGQASSIATLSLAYTNMSNTLTTVQAEMKKLEGGDTGERLELLKGFIENSEYLTEVLKQQGVDVNNLKGSEEERLKLLEDGVTGALRQANAVRGVAEAAKAVDEAFASLRQSVAITTPYTEASKALTDLTRQIRNAKNEQKEGDTPTIITEQVSRKTALDLGLGPQYDTLTDINKQIKDNQAIAEKGRQAEKTFWNTNFGTKQTRDRLEQERQAGALAQEQIARLEEQREIESAIFEERVRQNAEAIRQLDFDLKTAKARDSSLKSQIGLAKRNETFARGSIQARIDLENQLLQSKVKSNNLLITEQERRGDIYKQDIQRLATAYANAKTDEERAAIQDQLRDVGDEYLIVQAEINRLTAENKELNGQIVQGKEAELQIAQGAMKAVQLRQKYERATTAELQKQVGFQNAIASTQLKIEKLLQQGTRKALTPQEEVTFAKKQAETRINAAVREFNIKSQMIELDYALLEAKKALMVAEIAAEVERNRLSKEEGDRLTGLIKSIDAGAIKSSALQAAAAGVAETIVEGQIAVQKASADARESILKDQRDYADAFVKGAKRQAEILLEIQQLGLINPFTGEVDLQFLAEATKLAESERQTKMAFLQLENSMAAQRLQDQIDADTARVNSMGLSAEGAKAAQQVELQNIERKKELLEQQQTTMTLEEELLAKQFELERMKQATESIKKAAESGNAGAGLAAAGAVIQGMQSAAPKTPTEEALEAIAQKFDNRLPEAQIMATEEMGRAIVEQLVGLPDSIANALARVLPGGAAPEGGSDPSAGGTTPEASTASTGTAASISTEVNSSAAETASEVEAGVDVSPLQQARLLAQGFAADLSQLGPEGQAMGAFVSGGMALADSISSTITNFENAKGAAGKAQAIMGGISSAIGAIGQMMKAQSDMAVAAIDKEIAAEKKKDGKSKESLAKIKQLEAKKEAIKRKAFEKDKKMKMAQAVINTASAVLQMLGSSPFPANIILAALAAAMGAAQIAMISSATYQGGGGGGSSAPSMPSSVSVGQRTSTVDLAKSQSASGELGYLRGGMGVGGPENFKPAFMGAKYRAMGGSTTGYVVGEQGPELFLPDRPGTVVPADETENLAGGTTNVNFSINAVDSRGVEDMLTEQRGNIIGMIREAANSYGDLFLEGVDTGVYTPSSMGAKKA